MDAWILPNAVTQFSLFDFNPWPTTLTYNPRLTKVKVDPHAKNQGQRSNGSNRRAPTDKRTGTHKNATKRIISPATRSIKNILNTQECKFYSFLDKIRKLLTYHLPFFRSLSQKLWTLENSPVCYGPSCSTHFCRVVTPGHGASVREQNYGSTTSFYNSTALSAGALSRRRRRQR